MTPSSANPSQSLAGKVILISGSSSGIGAATAHEVAGRGAHVIINYPTPAQKSEAEAVCQSLPASAKAFAVEADLSTLDGPAKLAAAAAAAHGGRIDVLVNNAGTGAMLFTYEPDDAVHQDAWDRVMNLNGRGTYLLTRSVLPYLSKSNSRIINISSDNARDPQPQMTIYAGSKGMIESFTRSWARELPRKYGCTVNCVAPGPVATEAVKGFPKEFHGKTRMVLESTPIAARMGEPEELAWVVAMLCEEGSSWVNGQIVPVNGGSVLS
ncbi:hypothetical protein B0J13DRAFT_576510 [Dactylonectria estremocensis]|uniref:Uncharacterized protein n=1 Tax=Dactylonectria estremocensis TaxID=1079267 RepID=A0A9P9D3G4_9HYPO|nr:hypothetical protein B0J13DRAFT_576510 [Dactylonectria estremocensis]